MAKKPVKKKATGGVKKLTAKMLTKLRQQETARKQSRKQSQQKQQAVLARDKFKPGKKQRGQIVFIGVNGQKTARSKGRKGYLIYVTKTGKKWLLKQQSKRGAYKPRKFAEIQPNNNPALRKQTAKFQKSKLVTIGKGISAVKGSGKVDIRGQWDFSDKVVSTIAKSIKKTVEGVASHRVFNIKVMVLFENIDGLLETTSFNVPIEKPDHIDISIDAMQNFVSKKFYAFLAQQLAFMGYVTSGSSNHVKSLSVNKGKDRSEWRKPYEDDKGRLRLMDWKGSDMDTVHIKKIEWQLEQVKTK